MARREATAVITLSGPGEFNTGPWLLGSLCVLDALTRLMIALEFWLVVKAGYLLTGYKSPWDLVGMISFHILAGILIGWAGWLIFQEPRANSAAFLLLAALAVGFLLTLHDLWRDPGGATILLFAEGKRVYHEPVLAGLLFLESNWSVLVLLAAVLIVRVRRVDPSWMLVSIFWMLGKLLDTLLRRRFWPLNVMEWQEILWTIPPAVILLLALLVIRQSRRKALLLLRVALAVNVALIGWSAYETIRAGGLANGNWAAKGFGIMQAFVELPFNELVPLLLIVWAGRSAQSIGFRDDGSPWPRRYCGKCFYNLQGVQSEKCPECGTTLTEDSPSGQLVPTKNA